jgi:FKBP-type peptidyl-prolyl cis-trans isomerase 2
LIITTNKKDFLRYLTNILRFAIFPIMVVTENKFITLNYSFLTKEGTLLGSSDRSGPLTFRYGAGDIIPGLEKALAGLKEGDKKSFTVAPEEAYGIRDEKLVVKIQRTELPEGLEPRIGTRISWSHEGEAKVFFIADVQGEEVVLDGNHPLAGEHLDFDIEVTGIGDEDPFANANSGCGCGGGGCGCGGH